MMLRMRLLKIGLLLLAFSAAAVVPAQQSAPPPQDESARKARALIEQTITALGGNAWLNIQDMQQEGRTYGFQRNGQSGIGIQMWRFVKWPDKERIELTKKRDWTVIYNGEKGAETTFHGTAPLPDEDLRG